MIWLKRILQYAIGLILLATSIGKMLDVPGFIGVLRTYQTFPEGALSLVALAFVLVELKLAELLLLGKALYRAAAASTLLHLFFTAGAVTSLLRGLDIPNCGCFGVFLARPLTWGTVVEDLIMSSASVVLFLLVRGEVTNAKTSSSDLGVGERMSASGQSRDSRASRSAAD